MRKIIVGAQVSGAMQVVRRRIRPGASSSKEIKKYVVSRSGDVDTGWQH